MIPSPLTVASLAALAVGIGCAGWTLWDIHVRGRRLQMPIMELVWPITTSGRSP